jgi:putative ABC transport system substrate-binding protein
MPVIGYLGASSAGSTRIELEAFRQGLADAGFVEGRNVTTEYAGRACRPTTAAGRSTDLAYDLPDELADLVRCRLPARGKTPA